MRTLLTLVTVLVLAGAGWSQTPRPTGAPDSRLTERFRQVDLNGDGVITPDEARAAHLLSPRDFESVDADHSGTVTLFELGQALSRWLADFDAADANHDGKVTADEAARVPTLATMFTTINRDQHKAVSRQQYEAYAIQRLTRDSELPSVAPNIFEKRF